MGGSLRVISPPMYLETFKLLKIFIGQAILNGLALIKCPLKYTIEILN